MAAQKSLKPLDLLILMKLVLYREKRPPIARVGLDLSLSTSEVHASLKRLELARLVATTDAGGRPLAAPTTEFLLHGAKYAFPPQRGELTRGLPTAYAAPPLNAEFVADDLPPVWPTPHGQVRGIAFTPLHRRVPDVAARDADLYHLLALFDALRDGRARERLAASRLLTARLAAALDD